MISAIAKFSGDRLFNLVDAIGFTVSGFLIGHEYYLIGPLVTVPFTIISSCVEAYVRRISA